jgi:uncharacterized protein YjeT (DUF2065 family)
MWCGWIFGIIFVISGIYMIVTKRGWKVMSKRHEDVTDQEAVSQGVLALIIGFGIIAIILFTSRG